MLEAQARLPEVGQLVQVRQRRYAVLEVVASELTPSSLGGQAAPGCNLITLSSVDDEGIGDELRVVWELEAGAAVVERGSLPEPTGFDGPGRFDAFLNAVRPGAVSSADTKALQAPFRSGVDIEHDQLDPLVRALRMPRAQLY